MDSPEGRMARLGGGNGTGFTTVDYIRSRDTLHDFTMVEFGHDSNPVAFLQPVAFSGERRYTGVESWLRDPLGVKRKSLGEKALAGAYTHPNVSFVSHSNGGRIREASDFGTYEKWYEGPYDTRTALPDDSAHEVFASNVFGDPYLSHSPDRTRALLGEMARVAAPAGIVIIRETNTPDLETHLTPTLFDEVDVTPVAFVRYSRDGEDREVWDELECRYRGDRSADAARNSFYLFLQKHTTHIDIN